MSIKRQSLEERIEFFPVTASTALVTDSFVTLTSGQLVPCGTTGIPIGIVKSNVLSSNTSVFDVMVDTPFENDDFIMDISETLIYNTLTGDFDEGEIIVGSTSGAKATVFVDNDTTTMTIGAITGTFVVGEIITGQTSGAFATVGTVATFNATLVGTYVDIDATNSGYVDISVSTTKQVLVISVLTNTNQIVGRVAKLLADSD